jgi:hypothetical protein
MKAKANKLKEISKKAIDDWNRHQELIRVLPNIMTEDPVTFVEEASPLPRQFWTKDLHTYLMHMLKELETD